MNRIWSILITFLLLFSSCETNKDGILLTAPINEDYSLIANPFERWRAYNLSNYVIDEQRWCECFPPTFFTVYVIDNVVNDVEYEISEEFYYGRSENEIYNYAKNSAMTINKAFSIIEQYESIAHRIDVEYDQRYGFPKSIYIDIDSLMADEEIHRKFENLMRIVN
jgi:hypothetical protein